MSAVVVAGSAALAAAVAAAPVPAARVQARVPRRGLVVPDRVLPVVPAPAPALPVALRPARLRAQADRADSARPAQQPVRRLALVARLPAPVDSAVSVVHAAEPVR